LDSNGKDARQYVLNRGTKPLQERILKFRLVKP